MFYFRESGEIFCNINGEFEIATGGHKISDNPEKICAIQTESFWTDLNRFGTMCIGA